MQFNTSNNQQLAQAMGEKGTWPITSEDDASLSMTPDQAAGFMKPEEAKKGESEEPEEDAADDDLDDLA